MELREASHRHTVLEEKFPLIPRRLRSCVNRSLWLPVLVSLFLVSLLLNFVVLRHSYEKPHAPVWRGVMTEAPSTASTLPQNDGAKPEGFRIVGLVFAGRRDRLSILDCYLRRNLVDNGGFLDEVIFIQRTSIAEDITFLQTLVGGTTGYTLVDSGETQWGDYSQSWKICEVGTMYIKIDDDIVFIEDTTIPAVVRAKVEHPEALLISANALNQAALSWVHWHLGVVQPYLPELTPNPLPHPRPKHDWRASLLPDWDGPEDFKVSIPDFKPPFPGHRWLPVRSRGDTDNSPIATTEYATGTTGVTSWAVGAQQHYSFLEHLERGELWRYRFPRWDYDYMRLSITFIAIWGDDVVPFKDEIPADDEQFFTVTLPQRLKRHVVVDGNGLAAHFAFHTQEEMEQTDLLARYRAYAEENICPR